MGVYFQEEESIYYKQGFETKKIIETIAAKYIGENPASPYVFRTTPEAGFRQLEDGRLDMNFNTKFIESSCGDYGYGLGRLYYSEEMENELALSCYGPTTIFLNGKLFYKSTMYEEVNIKQKKILKIKFNKGFNEIFIKVLKTSSGFGCILGPHNSKWFPIYFLAPFSERKGMGGLVYGYHKNGDCFSDKLPTAMAAEGEMGIKWYPEITQNGCDLQKILGKAPNQAAYARSSFSVYRAGCYEITGSVQGESRIWINNSLVFSGNGVVEKQLNLPSGTHELLIKIVDSEKKWEFDIGVLDGGSQVALHSPENIKGAYKPWIFLGPIDGDKYTNDQVKSLSNVTDDKYWCIDQGIYIRPYLENKLYGKWNYPLGVTLYGLLKVSREFDNKHILEYVNGHISACTELYNYALWDKKTYGYPAVNHQLVELNMLDDCGSFGSAMLEASQYHGHNTYSHIAAVISDYIMHQQERKEDGVFYRKRIGNYMENTLWADDLYMSTPFLMRYYKLTGDESYIDEAAKQFLLFKSYLLMENEQVMSHVYDFKYQVATGVPWGRGNGWVIFSLSELLEVLPIAHPKYEDILGFFRLLAQGYQRLQGRRGLWHQVLNDSSSYEEASCTSMFVYAFCRGVRNGWIKEEREKYIQACGMGVQGLIKHCVDYKGNVYGVCRGSGYSFTPLYYKEELNWILNDPHGIGIVMLAITEYYKLQNAANEGL